MKKFLLTLIFLLLAVEAHAVTRYVKQSCTNGITTYNPVADTCTGGSSTVYNSIANGIAATGSGDTLYIRNGTYAERFTVPNGATVAGYPGDFPLIKPTTNGGAIVGFGNSGSTLQNLEVSALGLIQSDACVSGSAPVGNTVRDIKVHDCVRGPGGGDTTGIGVLLGGSGHLVDGLESYNNDNSDPSAAGDNGGYGIYLSATSSTVQNSYFHANGGYGAQIYPNGSNTFRTNRSHHNGYTARKSLGGVVLGGPSNLAYNNDIRDNKFSGIDASGCTSCQIYNNTIVNNGAPTGAFGIQTLFGSAVTIGNNILVNNPGGNLVDWDGTDTFSNNLCFSAGGSTHCATTADPLFVNSATDFHLQAGSPAITGATDLSALFVTDFDNLVRPIGTTFGIGSYVFSTGPSPALVLALSLDSAPAGVVTDSSGFANNGTLSGAVTTTIAGKYNGGLTFSGGQVTVASSTSLSSITTAFTIEAWVKPTTIDNTWRAIITKGGAYFLYATSSGTSCGNNAITGGFVDTLGNVESVCYGTPLTASVFAHLALTYDGATLTLYKDGASVATAAATGTVQSTSNSVLIGNSSVNEAFAGVGDEDRIYNYARSAAVGSGTCDDPSPNVKSEIECDRDTSIGTVVNVANAPIKLHANAAALKLGAGSAILKLGQ